MMGLFGDDARFEQAEGLSRQQSEQKHSWVDLILWCDYECVL